MSFTYNEITGNKITGNKQPNYKLISIKLTKFIKTTLPVNFVPAITLLCIL